MCLRTIQWLLKLCSLIMQHNRHHIKAQQARDVLPAMLEIKCIQALVRLLDAILEML